MSGSVARNTDHTYCRRIWIQKTIKKYLSIELFNLIDKECNLIQQSLLYVHICLKKKLYSLRWLPPKRNKVLNELQEQNRRRKIMSRHNIFRSHFFRWYSMAARWWCEQGSFTKFISTENCTFYHENTWVNLHFDKYLYWQSQEVPLSIVIYYYK